MGCLEISASLLSTPLSVEVKKLGEPLQVSVSDATQRLQLACSLVCSVKEEIITKPYTELEYIKGTGTQWIDTGLTSNINSQVDVTFSFDSMQQAISNNCAIFGGRTGQTSNTFTLFKIASTNPQYFRFDYTGQKSIGTSQQITWEAEHKYRFVYDGVHYTLENLTTGERLSNTLSPNTNESKSTISLFVVNTNGTVGSYLKGKIYSYSYSNGDTAIDLIPVLDKDGTACMYDLVSETFFYNKGTGNFIAGPEI